MPKPFDLVLTGGLIVDGTGTEPARGDVAIREGLIAEVGSFEKPDGSKELDVSGQVVCPGFIDIHSHSELLCLAAPGAESKVASGVTSEFSGNCGGSPFPVTGPFKDDLDRTASALDLKVTWSDAPGFFEELTSVGSAINRGFFVGHGTLRAGAMGHERRKPKRKELTAMKRSAAAAMEAGCWGLSTGLIYPPGCFAETDEIIALAKSMKKYGGIYTSHIRGESGGVLAAVEEALEIGRSAKIGVQIAHLKVSGVRHWPLFKDLREMLMEAYESGADFAADRYPYVASSTWLGSVLPSWTYEGGRERLLERLGSKAMRSRIAEEVAEDAEPDFWQRVRIAWVQNPELKQLEGMSVQEAAESRGQEPVDAVFEIILADGAQTSAIYFVMNEEHLVEIMQWPFVMVASDSGARGLSGPSAEGKPHPRGYGTPTRVLRRYVREKPVLRLAEAIRKMTSMPAERLGMSDRGTLEAGKAADVTVFDPEEITDHATFEEPKQLSGGVSHVLVGGTFVQRDGKLTGERPGKVLLKGEA